MFKVSGVVFVLLSALVAVTAAQSPSPAESTAIAHARRLYYNLQREGVRDLRCNAHPDWQQVLASMLATGADAKARALPYLSKIEFNVKMTAATTNVTTEQTDEPVPQDLAGGLGKLIELVRFNIQQPLDFWRMMTFKLPIPTSEENYHLEHRGGRYIITSTGVNVGQIELDENWIIQEIRSPVPGERVTVSMQPHYARNPNGLLLSSFDVRNIDEPSQLIQMTIEYLERDGLELPAAFGSKSQHPGGDVSLPVKFDHYEIRRH